MLDLARRCSTPPSWTLLVAVAALGLGSCDRGEVGEAVATGELSRLDDGRLRLLVDSDDIVVEGKIDSMDGPASTRSLALPGERPGELLWLTAVRNQAIDPELGDGLSPEFMCHSNLSLVSPPQLARDTAAFRATDNLDARVVTLIQGQNEVELPRGFGFPLVAGEPLEFFTMVINKNVDEVPFTVRVRTAVEYWRDDDLADPPVPLFRRRIFTFVEANAGGGHHGGHGHHEAAAGTASRAPSAAAGATLGHDSDGRTYTMHWLVPPGRHEYRSRITGQLRLPFDTTVHYATAHLHPHGASIALVDMATGESLFRLAAHPYTDRQGIEEMESFSSVEGLRLERDRDYELVTVYVNPTGEPIDAMGILYLHLRDHAFERLAVPADLPPEAAGADAG